MRETLDLTSTLASLLLLFNLSLLVNTLNNLDEVPEGLVYQSFHSDILMMLEKHHQDFLRALVHEVVQVLIRIVHLQRVQNANIHRSQRVE